MCQGPAAAEGKSAVFAEPLPRPIELGPFLLDRRVGKGGMASVYGGVHVGSSLPVAVKVLDPQRAADPVFQRCFDTEVQAVAALDHPGIVLVFDYGTIPGTAAAASDGRLVEGSAWLAMELATGGSLSQQQLPLKWDASKAVLLSLLDGLAHAHARGVIHRDIKRGNVLLSTEHDARPGPKLTDFGLAHLASEGRPEGSAFAGTPNYMSPEQCEGRWRDYGPWTDLYSLGCLAWALVSGGPPFVARTVAQVVAAHRDAPPPPLAARTAVPPGLEAWLRRLLEKNPAARFGCCADAARALMALAPPVGGPEGQADDGWEEAGTRVWTLSSLEAGRGEGESVSTPPPRRRGPRAPVPASWRRSASEAPSPRLQGAGLGLWGLRDRAVVGRERERDRLWEELQDVAGDGVARLVILEADVGLGASRLARWLAARSEELGAANAAFLHAEAGPAGLVAEDLHTEGLKRALCRRRVAEQLSLRGDEDAAEADLLTELVLPGPPGRSAWGPGEHQFSTQAERYEAVARHLDRMSRGRALVLVADELVRDDSHAAFLRHLLDRQAHRPSPWLLVVSRRAGVDLPPPLQDLEAARLLLDPLEDEALRDLLGGQLQLSAPLAEALVERSAGNPMFALSLLGDWIERELLVLADDGFDLAETPALPDDLHDLWQNRIDAVVDASPEGTEQVLELAALLGPRVAEEPWRAACAHAEVPWSNLTARRLVHAGLLRPDGEGWRLAHPLLEESLLRTAGDMGRLPRAHLACAQALQGAVAPAARARRAEHLAAAGRTGEASAELRRAAEDGRDREGLDRCVAWLERADAIDPALDGAGRLKAGMLRADVLLAAGRIDDAVAAAAALEDHPSAGSDVRARAALLRGIQALRAQNLDAAWVAFDRALELYRGHGDAGGEARALRYQARTLAVQGRLDGARAHARQGLEAARRSGDAVLEAEVLAVSGGIERRAGEHELSSRLCQQAAAIAEQHGRVLLGAEALLLAGESLRALGQVAEAGRAYREARNRWRRVGSRYALVAELNLAMLDVRQRAWDEAALRLEAAAREAEALGDSYIRRGARMLLLPCLAARGFWDALAQGLAEAEDDPGGLMSEVDTAESAELAGVLAAADGPKHLAGRAWWLAHRMWGELERQDRQEILEDALRGADLPVPPPPPPPEDSD